MSLTSTDGLKKTNNQADKHMNIIIFSIEKMEKERQLQNLLTQKLIWTLITERIFVNSLKNFQAVNTRAEKCNMIQI